MADAPSPDRRAGVRPRASDRALARSPRCRRLDPDRAGAPLRPRLRGQGRRADEPRGGGAHQRVRRRGALAGRLGGPPLGDGGRASRHARGAGVEAAVPMGLVVVGLTSAFGAAEHWRDGSVSLRSAIAFGPPAILGALLGADLGLRVSATVQLTVFAVAMLAAAVSMYAGAARRAPQAPAAEAVSTPPGGRRPRLPFVTLV